MHIQFSVIVLTLYFRVILKRHLLNFSFMLEYLSIKNYINYVHIVYNLKLNLTIGLKTIFICTNLIRMRYYLKNAMEILL